MIAFRWKEQEIAVNTFDEKCLLNSAKSPAAITKKIQVLSTNATSGFSICGYGEIINMCIAACCHIDKNKIKRQNWTKNQNCGVESILWHQGIVASRRYSSIKTFNFTPDLVLLPLHWLRNIFTLAICMHVYTVQLLCSIQLRFIHQRISHMDESALEYGHDEIYDLLMYRI